MFTRLRILILFVGLSAAGAASAADAPVPLLSEGHPVDWWFVYKFNAKNFPKCSGTDRQSCPFGGKVQKYTFGQQFAVASSESHALKQGSGCVGDTESDPVGATYDEIYNGHFSYVVWNDQFHGHPLPDRVGPWGHAKGIVAWNDDGEGLVIQVTTPDWPGSGSKAHPRKGDGNSLGCMAKDDVLFAQHFFALKVTKDDLVKVLTALENASVVTKQVAQLVSVGDPDVKPPEVKDVVAKLGKQHQGKGVFNVTLSSGVTLISKPSALQVPPWQLVSALLDGASLRTATFWGSPTIPTTKADTPIPCWDDSLSDKRGAVEVATTGTWEGTTLGMTASPANGNHAKIGVSTSGDAHYTVLGDLNQQGTLAPHPKTASKKKVDCASSQNGRGGLFFVVDDKELWSSVSGLLEGETAPTK